MKLKSASYNTTLVMHLFCCLHLSAQTMPVRQHSDTIEPVVITIGCNKTTNLLFPYGVVSVDRGSKDILVQKVKGVDNVLQLKAAKNDFDETNLSVITEDHQLYSFLLHYSSSPAHLNFRFYQTQAPGEQKVYIAAPTNKGIVEQDANLITREPRTVYGKRSKKFGISMRLDGVYIRDEVIYFQLFLQNSSPLCYDIDMLQFFIRDKKQSRRTASQEIPLQPLHTFGNTEYVPGDSAQTVVYALPKFTLADKKWLLLQMTERAGGRQLQLKMGNGIIVRAIEMNAKGWATER